MFTYPKKVAVWRNDFYPAKQSKLKSIQKALIGWKKSALQKATLFLDMETGLNVTDFWRQTSVFLEIE